MENDELSRSRVTQITILTLLLSACFTALLSSNSLVANELMFSTTPADRRRKRKFEDEKRSIMKNLFTFREHPQVPLGPAINRFGSLVNDENRDYCKKLTHMYSWEIEELLEKCKPYIEAPRCTSWRPKPKGDNKRGRKPKYDALNRLVIVLEWLSSGDNLVKMEMEYSYAKSSLDEDKKHVLKAICKALDDQIVWPNAAERVNLSSSYSGIFENVVGIYDCTEWYLKKSQDEDLEHMTFSGKAGTNTMKTLAVINKYGLYTFKTYLMVGRPNDREQFTSCPLYMEAGRYFSPGEKLACDGGFRGDGPHLMSYDQLDTESKKTFNLAFKEVRIGVENSFGRVQMWFPILGLQRSYWNFDVESLELATDAAMKLHNFLIRSRGLNYNAEDNPQNHHRHLY